MIIPPLIAIFRAIQRQQYHPGWCKQKFAELNTGWVETLEMKGPLVMAGDVRVEATSVCGGEVVARVCVVKDLSEVVLHTIASVFLYETCFSCSNVLGAQFIMWILIPTYRSVTCVGETF